MEKLGHSNLQYTPFSTVTPHHHSFRLRHKSFCLCERLLRYRSTDAEDAVDAMCDERHRWTQNGIYCIINLHIKCIKLVGSKEYTHKQFRFCSWTFFKVIFFSHLFHCCCCRG